ncbi:MAG: hypothetical protein L3J89_01295 [Gammaproteobacteria bacterium]|nr:hypothetical protein [Gammaproteobacteria bacterium]
MKETIIYLIVAISSLLLMAYTVHMFVGGLVEEETQDMITIIVLGITVIVMAFLGWDIVRRRTGGS